MTRIIGLVGYPLKHSLSPDFQQAAFDHYQLDIRYETWETPPERLPSVVSQLKQSKVIGANVTVPYKEKVLSFMDELDDMASVIGAVNTIVNRQGKLEGYNTDAQGFLQSLHEERKFDPEGKRAVILGAGGAARAVAFALLREKAGSLVIANRTMERAEVLVNSLRKHLGRTGKTSEIRSLPWQSSQLHEAARDSQLIVNCTTVGMRYSPDEGQSPMTADWIPQNALVYDLVYNPPETPLLREAKKADATTLNGLSMLVYQGGASFERWTGRQAPLDIMFSAVQLDLSQNRR